MGTLRFVVDIPGEYLEDVVRMNGTEGSEQLQGISAEAMADCLKGVILEGLEEYLGDEVSLVVRPVRTA